MTKEEAIKRIKARFDKLALDDKDIKAIQTLIPELHESEDEKIKKEIIDFIQWAEDRGMMRPDYHQAKRPTVWIAYLEKQKDSLHIPKTCKENTNFTDENERIRMAIIGLIEELQRSEKYFAGVELTDMLTYLEKQKDASKAIEAVERIDKYIDEHAANAHDMKDSNPDKKYYRGWDDALAKMSGILQDVYLGKKQKEQTEELSIRLNGLMQEYVKSGKDEEDQEHRLKCYQLFWDALGDSEFFKQKEQSITANDLDEEIHRFFDDCIDVHEAKLYGNISERIIPLNCYELTARHFAKWGEKQKEKKPAEITPNQFDGITYGMKGYSSEKPAEYADDIVEEAEEYTSKVACGEYGVEVTEAYIAGVLSERNRGTEWSENDEAQLDDIEKAISNYYDLNHAPQYQYWLEQKFKSLRLQPKTEWSEEDSNTINAAATIVEGKGLKDLANRLKSLRSKTNKKIYEVAKHELAIRFMSYLDDNRLEGKMCLSNSECEDIDKAFKEIDWKKIMQYVKKYLFHWKPSEEQIGALNYAYCELFKRKDVGDNILSSLQKLIDQLREQM